MKATAGIYYTKTGIPLTVVDGGGQGDGKPRAHLYVVPSWYEGAPSIPEETDSMVNLYRKYGSVRDQISRIDKLIAQLRASNDPKLRGRW